MKTISILKDFSRTPGPRYKIQGNNSGEQFREQILTNAVREAIATQTVLLVDLDGTSGYTTSFLEESFGGLIRIEKIRYQDVINHVKIKSDEDNEYLDEISEYLDDAKNEDVSVAA